MQPASLSFRQRGVFSLTSFAKSVALAGSVGFEVMSSRQLEQEPVPDFPCRGSHLLHYPMPKEEDAGGDGGPIPGRPVPAAQW